MQYEPISGDGKVLVDKDFFEEMKANYVRMMADLEQSGKDILEGKVTPAEEIFAELQNKYNS